MFILYILFIVFYTVCSKCMYLDDVKSLEIKYTKALQFVLDDATAKQRESRKKFEKLEKKFTINFSALEHWVQDVNTRINQSVNTINQLAQPALHDITARAASLNQLKSQLCNELIHLNRYRKEIEKQFRQYHDRLEKLSLLYTGLRFDVNVVDLKHIKQQINLFYVSAATILNEIQKIQEDIDKEMIRYKIDFKNELEQANEKLYEKFINHVATVMQVSAVQSDRIDQLERTNKKLECWLQGMTLALLTLTVFVVW